MYLIRTMSDSKNIARPAFYAFAVIHHIYALKYSEMDLDFSKSSDPRVLDIKQFALRYFTSWNFLIQLLYFILSMSHSVTPSYKPQLKAKLSEWKGYIFTSLMFPSTMFVTLMFWSLYSINREWVLPEAADTVLPAWLNHCMHTNIALFLLVEVLVTKHRLPSFQSAFVGISLFTFIYDFIFFFTYFESGRWLYGIFYVMKWHERILFMIVNYLTVVAVMKGGMVVQEYKSLRLRKMK